MDKETFSSYGWLVVTVIVIAAMIAFAPAFSKLITDSVDALLDSFGENATGAMDGIGAGE